MKIVEQLRNMKLPPPPAKRPSRAEIKLAWQELRKLIGQGDALPTKQLTRVVEIAGFLDIGGARLKEYIGATRLHAMQVTKRTEAEAILANDGIQAAAEKLLSARNDPKSTDAQISKLHDEYQKTASRWDSASFGIGRIIEFIDEIEDSFCQLFGKSTAPDRPTRRVLRDARFMAEN